MSGRPAQQNVAAVTSRRLSLLSDVLWQPVERLAAWGLVRAVLSECWFVQDTGACDGRPLKVAAALAPMT